MSHSLLFLGKNFFLSLLQVTSWLLFFSLSLGYPRMSLLQGPDGSQGPGRPPAVQLLGRGGSCSPMAPSRGDAQDDSLLLKVRKSWKESESSSRQLGSLIQAKQPCVWGLTCLEKG